jgi:hypothetical protein
MLALFHDWIPVGEREVPSASDFAEQEDGVRKI